MKKRIGLIGFGTIGRYLFDQLSLDDVEFVFIYDKARGSDPRAAPLFVNSPAEAKSRSVDSLDLVIEAATAEAVVEFAPLLLPHTDLAVFSSTAFADASFHAMVEGLCERYQHRLYVPHGAVLGLDGIFDGRAVLESVSVTTTKRPQALGRSDTSRTILYEGPTRGACQAFPRNVNVHAGIALAGLGFDRTQSIIVSDPASPGNGHTIEIKAQGCQFRIEVLSEPGSGVTGAYTPVSACASIRRILFERGIVTL